MRIRILCLFFFLSFSYGYAQINGSGAEDFNRSLLAGEFSEGEERKSIQEFNPNSYENNSAVKVFNRNDIPWKNIFPNVRKKTYQSNSQTVNLYAIKQVVHAKSNTFYFPSQEQDQVAFLIEGEGSLGFDKKIEAIKAGSTFFIPGGKDFSFTTKTPMAYVITFMPNFALSSIDEPRIVQRRETQLPVNTRPTERTQPSLSNSGMLTENEIKQFIYTWFVHFDKRDDAGYFTSLLTGSVYKTTYSEPTIRNIEDFKKWYDKTVKKRVSHNTFSIDDIKISPNPNGSVNVNFEVSWVAKISNGYLFRGAYEENWGLYVDENDRKIKISSYNVKQIR